MSDDEVEICTEQKNKYNEQIIKAILILDYTKKPFKQSDILKFLSKKPNRKTWNAAFDTAKIKLKQMGYSLLEVKDTKSYILTSFLFPLSFMYKFADEAELADRTLLILVLTYIFMKEGPVNNVDLFSHLQELRICHGEKYYHEYFGDVKKKILNEYVSQLYLEKIIDKESETFEIRWGLRAHAEVPKRSILEFVCDIGYDGLIKPENLTSHYQIVLEEESRDDDERVMVVDD